MRLSVMDLDSGDDIEIAEHGSFIIHSKFGVFTVTERQDGVEINARDGMIIVHPRAANNIHVTTVK